MQVTMHKADDGSIHDNAKACKARNVETRFYAAYNEAVLNDNVAYINDEGNRVVNFSEVAEFIMDNRDLMRKLLNDAFVVKRTAAPAP